MLTIDIQEFVSVARFQTFEQMIEEARSREIKFELHNDNILEMNFRTYYVHYEFLVMQFGISNSPKPFMNIMNQVYRLMMDTSVIVFLNDILVYSKTNEQHEEHLQEVHKTIKKWLYVKLFKCGFWLHEVHFLGHLVNENGILHIRLRSR